MDKAERLRAALRGDGIIDEDDQMRVHVIGIRDDGVEVSLGHVSAALLYQDPEGARAAMERIRWAK